jgi:hypothetical protein
MTDRVSQIFWFEPYDVFGKLNFFLKLMLKPCEAYLKVFLEKV